MLLVSCSFVCLFIWRWKTIHFDNCCNTNCTNNSEKDPIQYVNDLTERCLWWYVSIASSCRCHDRVVDHCVELADLTISTHTIHCVINILCIGLCFKSFFSLIVSLTVWKDVENVLSYQHTAGKQKDQAEDIIYELENCFLKWKSFVDKTLL